MCAKLVSPRTTRGRGASAPARAALLVLLACAACKRAPEPGPRDLGAGADLAPGIDVGDLAPGIDLAFVPAPHALRPQVPNQGGTLVAHPQLVTVTWTGDPLATGLHDFDAWVVGSGYFTGAMAEYGIGAGTDGGAFTLSPAPGALISDADLRTILGDAITGGQLPAPTADRIYVAYLPPGTVIEEFPGDKSCETFLGYHGSFDHPSGKVIYTVVPRCPAATPYTDQQTMTWYASHEIVEAASDPVESAHAWIDTDPAHPITLFGAELADLCDGHPIMADGYVVTAIYSNRAAAADERSCVPAPAGPNFGATPTPAILSVAPGQSATATFTVYATGPLPAPLTVVESHDPRLTLALSRSSAGNGDVIDATVTVPASATSGQSFGVRLLLYEFGGAPYSTTDYLVVRVP